MFFGVSGGVGTRVTHTTFGFFSPSTIRPTNYLRLYRSHQTLLTSGFCRPEVVSVMPRSTRTYSPGGKGRTPSHHCHSVSHLEAQIPFRKRTVNTRHTDICP